MLQGFGKKQLQVAPALGTHCSCGQQGPAAGFLSSSYLLGDGVELWRSSEQGGYFCMVEIIQNHTVVKPLTPPGGGVEFFTYILAICFTAASSTFCWISMTQTRSFDSEEDSFTDANGKGTSLGVRGATSLKWGCLVETCAQHTHSVSK